MSVLAERNRIIHALDVERKDDALRIAGAVKDYVDAVKLSYPLVLRSGLGVIEEVSRVSKLPVIACFKIADIPEMNRMIMQAAADAGAGGVTVHGFVGRDSVKACVDIGKREGVYVFVVAEMSHPGAVEFTQPLGEKVARMARDLDADGIVAPATRPNRVREYRKIVGEDLLILSPGVGAQGASPGDALLEGANFEIVGRSIYGSPNPAEAARQISLQVEEKVKKSGKDR